jgi:hypothetical protein
MSTIEAQVKQVVGSCTEITEKNGWVQFSIDAGSQYPVRLSTKLPALIEQARAVGNARSTWTYKESQGKENPNKPGTHFTNRYLEGVQIGGSDNGPQLGGMPAPATSSPVKSDVDWDAKERRDYRSRAWAQTLAAFQHTIKVEEDPNEVFLRLQPFQRKVFNDVCQSFAYPADDSDLPFG